MLIGHTSQVSFIVASLSTHILEQFVSISDTDGYVEQRFFFLMIILVFFFILKEKLNYGIMKMVDVLNIFERILNIVQFK